MVGRRITIQKPKLLFSTKEIQKLAEKVYWMNRFTNSRSRIIMFIHTKHVSLNIVVQHIQTHDFKANDTV